MNGGLCSVEGCGRGGRIVRGWCNKHYKRWRSHGDPLGGRPERDRKVPTCTVGDCDREHYGHGYCSKHYARWRAHGDPHTVLPPSGPSPNPDPMPTCSVGGCDEPSKIRRRALCGKHDQRRRRRGSAAWEPPSFEERFWSFVDARDGGSCWPWMGARLANGYGQFHNFKPHRVSYELAVGPIPEGLTIDHVCHTNDLVCPGGVACQHRACVNPAHLEPVTMAENIRRGAARQTHCKRGHEFTPENVASWARPGVRVCLPCGRITRQQRRAAQKSPQERAA